MTFRIAKKADLGEILAVQRSAFKDLYEKYHDDETSPYTETIDKIQSRFQADNYFYYVLTGNVGEIVGYVGIQTLPDDVVRIGILGVNREAQAGGVGSSMLNSVQNLFLNTRIFELDTILEESRLVAFYENRGFERFGDLIVLHEGMTLVKMRYVVPNRR